MSEKTNKTIGPNRLFDPTKESREEYELDAIYSIGIFSEKNGLVILEKEEQPLKSYPGDRGDEAISGSLYLNEKDKN